MLHRRDTILQSPQSCLIARKKDCGKRKRVGADVANYVARTAAARGTKVHHMCEDYLNNVHVDSEKWKEHERHFLAHCLFNQLKEKALCNINNIYAQEAGLYSDKYQVAGRVDCIADYKGKLSIIDFKTSTKERTDDWNENYYIQGAAYAEMFGERTGLIVDQVVILVVTEDGTVQEFVKSKHDYLGFLSEAVQDWRKENEIPTDDIDDDRVDVSTDRFITRKDKKFGQKEIIVATKVSFVETEDAILEFESRYRE